MTMHDEYDFHCYSVKSGDSDFDFDYLVSAYLSEARMICRQWDILCGFKGIPAEKRPLQPDEEQYFLILLHFWKKLFGFDTWLPLDHSDMDTLMHIRHFDLLLELYFNHKFRNFEYQPDFGE